MKTEYINIHTHYKPKIEGEYVIRNAFHVLSETQLASLCYRVSIGLHPWQLDQMDLNQLSAFLEQNAPNENVVAIGETGFDKFAKTSTSEQEAYFDTHYKYAKQFKKPLIIHSVKRYQELIPYIKKNEVTFILHGFTGSIELMRSLSYPHCYFSFGKSLFTPQGMELFKEVPIDQLFLETDNHTHLHIADIYMKAAEIKSIHVNELQSQISENYKCIFPFDALITY